MESVHYTNVIVDSQHICISDGAGEKTTTKVDIVTSKRSPQISAPRNSEPPELIRDYNTAEMLSCRW